MKIGFIGVQSSGKTTVFRLLTNGKLATPGKPNIACIHIPDKRLDFLSKVLTSKKTTYAEIEFIDPPGFSASAFSVLQQTDALIQVIPFFGDFKEPEKLMNKVNSELIARDLELCNERLTKSQNKEETELLNQCKSILEKNEPLREIEFKEEAQSLLRGFGFLTQKPMVLVLNYEDKELASKYPISFNAKLELEISELPEDERVEYEKEFKITELALQKFIRIAYPDLGIITFFTVVKDEARAWQIKEGTSVVQSAGKVHSDMERGFIKAQIIGFEDFKSCGSFKDAKEKGKLRLVNKDYTVQDGDIIEFKFNV